MGRGEKEESKHNSPVKTRCKQLVVWLPFLSQSSSSQVSRLSFIGADVSESSTVTSPGFPLHYDHLMNMNQFEA